MKNYWMIILFLEMTHFQIPQFLCVFDLDTNGFMDIKWQLIPWFELQRMKSPFYVILLTYIICDLILTNAQKGKNACKRKRVLPCEGLGFFISSSFMSFLILFKIQSNTPDKWQWSINTELYPLKNHQPHIWPTDRHQQAWRIQKQVHIQPPLNNRQKIQRYFWCSF